MVDYEFYVNDYLGSAIPEKMFSGLAVQARHWLKQLKRWYRVESSGEEAERMAICAMAETLWRRRNHSLKHSTAAKEDPRRELYEKASIYLDIFRGVDQERWRC